VYIYIYIYIYIYTHTYTYYAWAVHSNLALNACSVTKLQMYVANVLF